MFAYIPHIFKDKEIKEDMLNLRRKGYSYNYLSKLFKVDHSTIMYHCKKAGIQVPTSIIYKDEVKVEINVESKPYVQPIIVQTKTDARGTEWFLGADDEWICMGKSVKELKKDAQSRKLRILENKRTALFNY